MSAVGVFALLYLVALLKRVQTLVAKSEVRNFFVTAFIISAGLVFLLVVALTYFGKSTSQPSPAILW